MPRILLTGANGFIAVHILKVFLERGYEVVGTVRAEAKTTYLRDKFSNHADRLRFAIVPDITLPNAFNALIDNGRFDAVIHAASPRNLKPRDVVRDIYEPAIMGTLNILRAVKDFGRTIRRVILLSSAAAMIDGTDRPGYTYTERDWNPMRWEDGIAVPEIAYFCSKKLSEKAAWDFMEQESPHFALTTLLPPPVFGPPIHEITSLDTLNESCAEIYGYWNWTRVPDNLGWIWVDVRDLAEAHRLALESNATRNQRYYISNGKYSAQEFVEFMWRLYPEHAAAKNIPPPGPLYPPIGVYNHDTSKAVRDFGMVYRHTLEEAFVSMITRFQELETS